MTNSNEKKKNTDQLRHSMGSTITPRTWAHCKQGVSIWLKPCSEGMYFLSYWMQKRGINMHQTAQAVILCYHQWLWTFKSHHLGVLGHSAGQTITSWTLHQVEIWSWKVYTVTNRSHDSFFFWGVPYNNIRYYGLNSSGQNANHVSSTMDSYPERFHCAYVAGVLVIHSYNMAIYVHPSTL